jgi:hypothetical protein
LEEIVHAIVSETADEAEQEFLEREWFHILALGCFAVVTVLVGRWCVLACAAWSQVRPAMLADSVGSFAEHWLDSAGRQSVAGRTTGNRQMLADYTSCRMRNAGG